MALRVLLFSQTNHYGSSRLPKALKDAGFCVAVLAVEGNLIRQSRYLDAKFTLGANQFESAIRRRLETAFKTFAPDIIVPCDERAVAMVNYWAGKTSRDGRTLSPRLLQCLERSLGCVENLPQRASKAETIMAARANGVACPRQATVESLSDCRKIAADYGYPIVLKLSHGTSGNGVRICATDAELEQAYGSFRLAQLNSLSRSKRLLRGNWYGSQLQILVQEHVVGQAGISCASAVDGVAVSVITGLVEATPSQTGPASVVRLVNHPSIIDATVKMIAAFGVSGFVSFDFIVDLQGQAHLLECNPRPTKILHLGHLVGVELAGTLLKALQDRRRDTGCEVPTGERTVSFFPHEWGRDPASPSLQATYHDVPWEDPPLLAAVMSKWLGKEGKQPQPWWRRL